MCFKALGKPRAPRIRRHDTRHSAASLMLASGVRPKVVQEMLGHSHVRATLATSGHLTRDGERGRGHAVREPSPFRLGH